MLSGDVIPEEFMMQQVMMDASREPENPVGGGVWVVVRGFLSAKISVFFRSMGLMQSYKKGKLIHTAAGVVYPEES